MYTFKITIWKGDKFWTQDVHSDTNTMTPKERTIALASFKRTLLQSGRITRNDKITCGITPNGR